MSRRGMAETLAPGLFTNRLEQDLNFSQRCKVSFEHLFPFLKTSLGELND